ncbi:MAG: helix-turn-helix transcriptional regulator [Lachnospiraceae bacterium]|nr:helix-turn-helix transcriptional regulator [Lachnospiraceae bacterium]
MESIASSIGISVNYLCKIFKENTGTSIIHYLNAFRMEKAAILFLDTNLYLKEIAESVGISDQFYFHTPAAANPSPKRKNTALDTRIPRGT